MGKMFRCAILLYIFSFCVQGNSSPNIIRNIDSAFAHPFIYFPRSIPLKDEYDFIIIGCGTSGSLLANRLSQVPSFQILCLEAGSKENFVTDVPIMASVLTYTPVDWNYRNEYQAGICEGMKDKRCLCPRGKALGGSTVINYMIYNRGNSYDFDKWENMGNTGWSFKDVLPYFMKFENFKKIPLNDSSNYGMNGELNIEFSNYETDVIPYIIKSAENLGIPCKEINGEDEIGVSRIPFMVRDQRRLTAAQAFLFPIHDRPNLHVATRAFVKKIIIDPKSLTALGVEVSVSNITHTIKARKEVILSAGSINSPQLLMLSGIGPKKHLKELNIPVIRDLPVGKRLQDHVQFAGLFFVTEKETAPLYPFPVSKYVLFAQGPGTMSGGVEAFAFVNTRNTSSDSSGLPATVPDIEFIFTGLARPILSFFSRASALDEETFHGYYGKVLGSPAFGIAPVLIKPKSIGYLELKSADPFDHPKIYSNYLKDEADIDTLLRAIRLGIRIGLGDAMDPFKPKLLKLEFKQCVKYTYNSDDFWKCALRVLSTSIYHPVGTCKMGPVNDREAVVDPQLRVKGMKKLRVVDASVIPEIPSGHTTSTCYVIAEKAADMIKKVYSEDFNLENESR